MKLENQSQSTNTTAHQLRIDRNHATNQLEALGYNRGDAVYIRAFLPKEDPRYGPGTGRKADKLNWEQVERWQAEGYGIYLVVNGGGHKDEDVTSCRAIFCEFDDRPIEDQIFFWRDLGLPEPSLQIATRKSVHSYWVFDEPIPVSQWRKLQAALLTYTGSDPALKNPSRVMRMAGSFHFKPGCEPLRCEIIHQSSNRYSFEELRSAIPLPSAEPVEPELPLTSEQKPQSSPNGAAPQYQRYDDIAVPVLEAVPMEVCLSKESRNLLASGVSEGGRNSNGAKLARDLIGTANHLQAVGQGFSGTPRQLLDEYAARCTPPLPAKETDAIWKSAEKDRPGPSCKPEGVEACIKGWYWNSHVKPNQQHRSSDKRVPNEERNGRTATSSKPAVESLTLRERVTEILSRNLSASELTAALVELSSATGRQLREIKELAQDIETDLEIEDGRSDRGSEIDRLHQLKQRQLTLDKYLPSSLASPMTQMAAWMGVPAAAFLVVLLPTVASLLDPATEVVVKECIGFIERAVIYAGIVTESGQRKSPLLNAITDGLRNLQQEEDARFRQATANYEDARKSWDPKSGDEPPDPPRSPREYYIDKATMEAVDVIKQNQPEHGLLWLKDELSGLMASYGEYKNGRGADKESMLSGWNGRGVKKNLKGGERISVPQDAMSVVGAIQDATLQNKMGDFNDDQGDWARFLWFLIPLKALKLPESDTTFQLAMLESLYRRFSQLPAQRYRFAFDAQAKYDGFHWQLEQRRVAEPRRGMRAAIAKMEGYAARLALILHMIWEVEAGKETPSPYIPRERVEAACKLAEFFLGQVELIHVEGAAAIGNDLTPRLTAILDKARQFGELTARKVQAAISWLRKVTAGKIRNDFKELAKLGYGVCTGQGNRLKFVPKTADTVAKTADRSADKSDSSQALDLRQFQDLPSPTADGVDADRCLVEVTPGETDAVEVPSVSAQQLSSCGLNPDGATIPAADEVSAQVSAVVSAVDEPDDEPPDDDPGGGTGVSLPVLDDSNGDGEAGAPPPVADSDISVSEMAALILQCQTWVEIVEAVEQNTKKLIKTTNHMTKEQRQSLVPLLATHLCQNPAALNDLTWVPMKLRARALELLTFTIERIGETANVLDTCLERISGCKFVSVENLGTRNLRWVFLTPSGSRIPVFGVNEIQVLSLI